MGIKKQLVITSLLSTAAVLGGCDLLGNKSVEDVIIASKRAEIAAETAIKAAETAIKESATATIAAKTAQKAAEKAAEERLPEWQREINKIAAEERLPEWQREINETADSVIAAKEDKQKDDKPGAQSGKSTPETNTQL
ncbi:MAG: hypothetical protein EU981_05035 [Candidatus Liberibacter ctenarytainae]|uniref:Lipoprotein n=1 Tax=Candidatus Liberibacter ctenarytainae TaxID=2020335 RepID=A0A937DLP6_9HYPH|nr:hypothetical protein [Candidatus Liberibacter ctenarytainae]